MRVENNYKMEDFNTKQYEEKLRIEMEFKKELDKDKSNNYSGFIAGAILGAIATHVAYIFG